MDKEEWQKRGEGHRERLRTRFMENGLEGFSDSEIVELLLTFGTPRKDCKIPARALMERFGSLAAVLEASPTALSEVRGVGEKSSFALQFIQAVSRRYLKSRLAGKRYLTSSSDVRDYLLHSMRGLKKEVLTVIYLDASHGIIDSEVVSEGTINVNTVYPRELIIGALGKNAAAIIIAHNHPSGSVLPSPHDDKLTKNLYLIGQMLQIRVLDHIIIGEEVYSYADHGRMLGIKRECEMLMENLN